jgi:hypothetical protein
VVHVGPCQSWIDTSDFCHPCTGAAFATVETTVKNEAILAASQVLFVLSGKRFAGNCSTTVRPCVRSIYETRPVILDGSVDYDFPWTVCSCQRGRDCGCTTLSEITLGASPIRTITRVRIDGVDLDPTRYRVDDHRYLVRLPDADGVNPGWPCCQRLDRAATEDETFEVQFTYGREPPEIAKRAAAELACQLALSCSPTGAGTCRLPQRVQSISRQGVSMTVLDPFNFLDNGRTGLYICDLFLATYNPSGVRRPGAVMSPDWGRRVRRVGTETATGS